MIDNDRSYSANDSRVQSPKLKAKPKQKTGIKPYLIGAGLGTVGTLLAPYLKEAAQYLWNRYQIGPKIYRIGNNMRNRLYNGATALKNQFNKGARFMGNKIADGLLTASNYIRPSNSTATPTPTPSALPSVDAIGHN